jgi:hypothetical protein
LKPNLHIYNRYKHCDQTFYTGRNIKEIVCNECDEQIGFTDIIKTREPVSNEDYIEPFAVFESEDELSED